MVNPGDLDKTWTAADLRQARRAAGLTQAALADRMDVRLWLVDQWESGARPIPQDRSAELEDALTAADSRTDADDLPLREDPSDRTMTSVPEDARTSIDLVPPDFPRSLRGYEPHAVHARLGELEAHAARLARDLDGARSSISELEERLQRAASAGAGPDLREEETLLRDALVTAQKAANDVREQAHRDAAEITESARRSSEQLVQEAEAERSRLADEIRWLAEHVEASRAAVRAFLNTLLAQVDARADEGDHESGAEFDHELLRPSAKGTDADPADAERAADSLS